MIRKWPVRDLDFEIEAGPVDTRDLLVEIDGDSSATAAERKIPKSPSSSSQRLAPAATWACSARALPRSIACTQVGTGVGYTGYNGYQ
jgi:hypothetical protein